MNKIILTLVTALIFATFSYAESYSPAHQRVVEQFKSKQEPAAKDAIWTARNILKVGVLNNGSNRDGYAEYVCEVLYENGFKGQKVWVQVIDVAQLVRLGKWKKLGQARCF